FQQRQDQASCCWGLTIHSSRPRLAGRLNSGVRPHMTELALLMVAIALVGCSTHQAASLPFLCGNGTPEQWQLTAAPPPDAGALESLADSSPNFPAGKMAYPIEQWFSTSAGDLMLCRRDKSSCMGEWWQFQYSDDKPAISRQDAWICVTGVWPNNSFKPT